ncbi:MAG TPA: caspase family protein, partial [Chloroflexia bacterium]
MPFTHGHALIVGVGTYQDPALSIPIAEMDARALAGILADPAVAGYPPNQVRLLTGPDASRKGILQAISDIAATVGRDSTVLLYFSGHAVSAPNGSYSFLPYDAHPGARGLVLGGRGSRRMVQFDRTTVSGSELLDAIRRIRASEVLVIFNTGLSALAGEGLAPTNPQERTQVSGLTLSPPPEDLMDAVLSTGEGRVVLSACRPNQKSWYFPYAFHTLFGLALLEGISDTRVIPDRNGYVSISDLYDYVYERVQEVTRNSGRDIDQEPVLTIMSSLRRFSVAQHMGGDLAAGFVGAENVKRPRERYAPDVRRITERQALEACQRIAGTGGGIIDVGRYNVEGIVGPIGHKADTLVQIIDGLDSMRYETEVSDVGIGADLSGEDTTRQLEGAADVTAETAKSIEEATPLPSTPPVAPGERLINTGFSSQSAPAQPFSAEMPLACNQPYYFWLEIGPLVKGAIEEEPTPLPVELLPAEAELTVALFAFDGELGLTWGADTGKLKLLPDGTVRVVSQPGQLPLPHHAVGLIRKRLFFPVQTARRAGTYRLRCNIYYEHVLVDSRLVSARVMRKPRATPGIHALRARR